MADIFIRKAELTDAEIIHEIHKQSVKGLCIKTYTSFQIENWLKNRTSDGYKKAINNGEMYICEYENKIIGFGHAIKGEIVANFVLPEYSEKGIGKKLLEYGIEIAKKDCNKIILVSTSNAVKFYEKFGFNKIKEYEIIRNSDKLEVIDMELVVNN